MTLGIEIQYAGKLTKQGDTYRTWCDTVISLVDLDPGQARLQWHRHASSEFLGLGMSRETR